MDLNTFEAHVRLIFAVATVLLRPFARLESLCLWLLGFDDATTFRMLPERDAHPEFPALLPNDLSLIWILMIPHLVWLENLPGRGFFVARTLRPLTDRCGRWGRWAFMLPRVWLFTAIFNHSMFSFLVNPNCVVWSSLKISFAVWLL